MLFVLVRPAEVSQRFQRNYAAIVQQNPCKGTPHSHVQQ
jgi:hypothetical protein